MNSLNRDIKQGEVVVVSAKYMNSNNQALEKRLFLCNGSGFGTISGTAGTAIYGRWVDSGARSRIEGFEIGREETLKYQQD